MRSQGPRTPREPHRRDPPQIHRRRSRTHMSGPPRGRRSVRQRPVSRDGRVSARSAARRGTPCRPVRCRGRSVPRSIGAGRSVPRSIGAATASGPRARTSITPSTTSKPVASTWIVRPDRAPDTVGPIGQSRAPARLLGCGRCVRVVRLARGAHQRIGPARLRVDVDEQRLDQQRQRDRQDGPQATEQPGPEQRQERHGGRQPDGVADETGAGPATGSPGSARSRRR